MIKYLNPQIYKKILGARLNLKPIKSMPTDWTYRFTTLQAKRGLKQLKLVDKLDKDKIKNVNYFRKNIDPKFLQLLPKELKKSKNVYWQYPIYIKNTDEFLKFMVQNNIDIGTTNLSLCSYLNIYPEYKNETKKAYIVKNNYFFVPLYQGLKEKQIKRIVKTINEFLENQDDQI
jgi:dTDP-4-amino-4,6-dideoxygalactose transaminase